MSAGQDAAGPLTEAHPLIPMGAPDPYRPPG